MTKRSRIVGFGSALLLVIAGAAGAVAFGGTLGQVIALALIGLGLVLATGLVFLEVGLSEDRERAEVERQASGAKEEPGKGPSVARSGAPRPRPRLERRRGSRRRLS